LLKVVELRWLARGLGVEKIVLKKSVLITYFVSNPDSPFYSSEMFRKIIGNIQARPGNFRLREDQEKLSIRSDRVHSVEEALEILRKLGND
jgi:transcription-repair coupling factor (superfamily II helicase)